jgi:hypothetical protein
MLDSRYDFTHRRDAEYAEKLFFSFGAERPRLTGGMTGRKLTIYGRPPAKENSSAAALQKIT